MHVAAALDPIGGLLGVREFPVSPAGYAGLLGWLGGFGTVCLAGIEGTAATGLAWPATSRRLVSGSWRWTASDRQDRRRQGKSDPLDAVSAARAAQSGRARGASKGRDGVEAIRALMVARRSAAGERSQTINQARALVLTGPEDLRSRFTGHTMAALVAELASLRPRPGSTVGYATRIALRELGRRESAPSSWPLRPSKPNSSPARSGSPERFASRSRRVARAAQPLARSSGTCAATGSSSDNRPASARRTITVATIDLVSEPTPKRVSRVTGSPVLMSPTP